MTRCTRYATIERNPSSFGGGTPILASLSRNFPTKNRAVGTFCLSTSSLKVRYSCASWDTDPKPTNKLVLARSRVTSRAITRCFGCSVTLTVNGLVQFEGGCFCHTNKLAERGASSIFLTSYLARPARPRSPDSRSGFGSIQMPD